MKAGSKILVGVILFLVVLSVSATFYKTVVLQDFDVTGVYVEFPTEDSSYVWFVYDNEEYELELETSDYDEIVTAVAGELGIPQEELDADFLEYLASAYDEGEVTGTGEEEFAGEEGEEESLEEGELSEEVSEEASLETEAEATSTEEFSDAELVDIDAVIESEI